MSDKNVSRCLCGNWIYLDEPCTACGMDEDERFNARKSRTKTRQSEQRD